jgi:hypothetical protein
MNRHHRVAARPSTSLLDMISGCVLPDERKCVDFQLVDVKDFVILERVRRPSVALISLSEIFHWNLTQPVDDAFRYRSHPIILRYAALA